MDIAGSNLSASGDDDNEVINQLELIVAQKQSAIHALEQHNANLYRDKCKAESDLSDAKLTIIELQTMTEILQARLDASNRALELASYERVAA